MRTRACLLGLALVPAGWGCGGDSRAPLEPVPQDKLPPGSLEAAAKAVPGFKFERARKATYNGQESIELIGKDRSGKIKEVEVSTGGEVLEVE